MRRYDRGRYPPREGGTGTLARQLSIQRKQLRKRAHVELAEDLLTVALYGVTAYVETVCNGFRAAAAQQQVDDLRFAGRQRL